MQRKSQPRQTKGKYCLKTKKQGSESASGELESASGGIGKWGRILMLTSRKFHTQNAGMSKSERCSLPHDVNRDNSRKPGARRPNGWWIAHDGSAGSSSCGDHCCCGGCRQDQCTAAKLLPPLLPLPLLPLLPLLLLCLLLLLRVLHTLT